MFTRARGNANDREAPRRAEPAARARAAESILPGPRAIPMDVLWRPVGVAAAAAAAAWCAVRHRAASSSSAPPSSAGGLTAWFPASRLRHQGTALRPSAVAQWKALRAEASYCVGSVPSGGNDGAKTTPTAEPYAIILLNTEPGCALLGDRDRGQSPVSHMLAALWSDAAVIVVADGAANYLYDSALSEEHRRSRLPHFITGDLDSIRPEVLEYYAQAGVETAPRPSQDAHDFSKSLVLAEEQLQLRGKGETGRSEEIYVFCSAGGRFDHVAALVATLYEHARYVLSLPPSFRPSFFPTCLTVTLEGDDLGVVLFGLQACAGARDAVQHHVAAGRWEPRHAARG